MRKLVAVVVALIFAVPAGCAAMIATSEWDSVKQTGYLVEVKLPDDRLLKMRYDIGQLEMQKQIAAELAQISNLDNRDAVLGRLWGEARELAYLVEEGAGHARDATAAAVILSILALATLASAFVPRNKQTQHNQVDRT